MKTFLSKSQFIFEKIVVFESFIEYLSPHFYIMDNVIGSNCNSNHDEVLAFEKTYEEDFIIHH